MHWRQGMVLVEASLHPHASWEFDADIAILTHSTTIAPKYQAVIHCEIVRQAARVVAMDRERLRSGDSEPAPWSASQLFVEASLLRRNMQLQKLHSLLRREHW